jgi:hypothetical protein
MRPNRTKHPENPPFNLALNPFERSALDILAEEKGMSKTQVMRQALRLYQLVHDYAKQGKPIQIGESPVIIL